MNWHTRYAQQANWTRDLRNYIFGRAGLEAGQRVCEVGCGTGAVLSELPGLVNAYGLDIDPVALTECRVHAPAASLVQGNALELPYPNKSFEIVYSHFLLLWVRDPSQALDEMKRVTRPGGSIIAFAEPDYSSRIDKPEALIQLGKWQTASLVRQGADAGIGSRLAGLFHEAGINLVEAGTIQGQEQEPSSDEWEIEWDVIDSDLRGWVADADIHRMKQLDKQARDQKTRQMHVPTHFAWGRV